MKTDHSDINIGQRTRSVQNSIISSTHNVTIGFFNTINNIRSDSKERYFRIDKGNRWPTLTSNENRGHNIYYKIAIILNSLFLILYIKNINNIGKI